MNTLLELMNKWAVSGGDNSAAEKLLWLFPDVNADHFAAFELYISEFRSYVSTASWLFPVNTMMYFIRIILAIELLIFTYNILRKVVALFTGQIIKL